MEKKQMVRVIDKAVDPAPKMEKNPERKQYLICIRHYSGDDFWEIAKGRTNAYYDLKNEIEADAENINFDESFILVEGHGIETRKSLYAFLIHVKDQYFDRFDINDYIKGDWSEYDYALQNDLQIDEDVENNKISMESIMNGETVVQA